MPPPPEKLLVTKCLARCAKNILLSFNGKELKCNVHTVTTVYDVHML